MRDLFIRHDRLSGDNVERLKKRIETTQMKLEGIRAAQKEGWAQEVDKLTSLVERDQITIQQLLNRRIFIRYSCVIILRLKLHFLFNRPWLVECGMNCVLCCTIERIH